jgi:sulfite reductase (ferredoxin)
MTADGQIQFPCARCPDDPGTARLLGLYNQRQDGLLMQRVKVHAGAITAEQWRTVAQLAREHTPDYPLHLTTRQDIELHGLVPSRVPAVHRGLADVGLTTVGACGDTLRNVTTCPGNGLNHGSADVGGIADAIRAAGESLPFIRSMPRKFKISISGCPRSCARPWINDLGLIASHDGTFRAILAGSLGARPGTGIDVYAGLELNELVPLAIAAIRLFNAEGDRQNRQRARLRHVRERIGDEAFKQKLDELFQIEKAAGRWPTPEAPQIVNNPLPETRLLPPLGDFTPDLALQLADAASTAGAEIRLGFEHDLFIYGNVDLTNELKAMIGGPRVVACPGSTWCERGITDTRAAATRIHGLLAKDDDLSICLSGCPNNCAHAAVADIGLTGRIRNIDGVPTQCFRLLAGGDKGAGPRLAVELAPTVPAGQAPGVVQAIVRAYANDGKQGEAFADYVRREQDTLTGIATAGV